MSHPELIRYTSKDPNGFSFVTYHLKDYDRVKCSGEINPIAFYFFFGEEELICRSYQKEINSSNSSQLLHKGKRLFSIKYANIDQSFEKLKTYEFDSKNIIDLKDEFKKLITAIFVEKNYSRSPEIINFKYKIKGSQVELWGAWKNLNSIKLKLTKDNSKADSENKASPQGKTTSNKSATSKGKDSTEANKENYLNEFRRLHKLLIDAILNNSNHQNIRDFPLFKDKDEEDLVIEINRSGAIVENIENNELNNRTKLTNFFLARYNFSEGIGLIKNDSVLSTILEGALHSFTSPIVHLIILAIFVFIFGLEASNSFVFVVSVFMILLVAFIQYFLNKNYGPIKIKGWVLGFVLLISFYLMMIYNSSVSLVPLFSKSILLYSFIFTLLNLFVFPLLLFIMKIKYSDSEPPSITLLSPKLIVSNIIGWFLIMPILHIFWSVNSYLIYNKVIYFSLLSILFFLIFIFIYNELKTVKPKINIFDAIYRMAILFFRGLPISLFFGMMLMSMTFPRFMNNPNVYPPSASLVKFIDSLNRIDSLPRQLTELIINPIENANFKDEHPPIDTTVIFQNKNLKNFYSEIGVHIARMEKCKITKDSLVNSKINYDTCKEKIILMGYDYLNEYYEDILNYKYPIIDRIGKKACGTSMFPCIVSTDFLMIRYIFPPLLILGATMSFLIGFFIQFVRTSMFTRLKV
jgi:Predicted membrane protein